MFTCFAVVPDSLSTGDFNSWNQNIRIDEGKSAVSKNVSKRETSTFVQRSVPFQN